MDHHHHLFKPFKDIINDITEKVKKKDKILKEPKLKYYRTKEMKRLLKMRTTKRKYVSYNSDAGVFHHSYEMLLQFFEDMFQIDKRYLCEKIRIIERIIKDGTSSY